MKSWPIALLCLLKLFIPHNSSGCNCQLSAAFSRCGERGTDFAANELALKKQGRGGAFPTRPGDSHPPRSLSLPGLCVGSPPSFRPAIDPAAFYRQRDQMRQLGTAHMQKSTRLGDGAALPAMNIPASHTLSGDLGAMCRHIAHC